MSSRSCFNCCFFIKFTQQEIGICQDRLREHDIDGAIGACSFQERQNPRVIRFFVTRPILECSYWEAGFFEDDLNITCPQCGKGNAVIKRPRKDKKIFLLIGCTRYPDCTFSTKYFPLKINCKYCDIPLVLGAEESLSVTCPRCHRRASVPFTILVWPYLLTHRETCPHNYVWTECTRCSKSKEVRTNLLDIELPDILQIQGSLANVTDRIISYPVQHATWDYEETYYTQGNSSWNTDELDEFYQERLEDLENYARSNEEGWFYRD